MSRSLILCLPLILLGAVACDEDAQSRPSINDRAGRKPPQQTTPGAMPTAGSPCAQQGVPLGVTPTQNLQLDASGLDEQGAWVEYPVQSAAPRTDEFHVDLWDVWHMTLTGRRMGIGKDELGQDKDNKFQLTGVQSDFNLCSFCVWLDLDNGTGSMQLMAAGGSGEITAYNHAPTGGTFAGTITNALFKQVDDKGHFVEGGCNLLLPTYQFQGVIPDVYGVYSGSGTTQPSYF